ncbi:MAG: homoserine dehydrogenase [Oscillospiraceae bacterium]|nr:homoserine dehydrogenase [Oscillospiraceae bacterium]
MSKIAIIGHGTVGSGVSEVLRGGAELFSRRAGRDVSLKYILDINPIDDPCGITDFSTILNDPEVDVVVETVGGATHALDYTRAALNAHKSVISSNKELVATYGDELLALAHESNVNYLFEGAVGGGIPIIRPISQCLLANRLEEVYGILNGTTNFILTKMTDERMDFAPALKRAQELGYAERDPADDISGKDVCRKICILASLAFGHHVYPDDVPTTGVEDITAEDIIWAKSKGYAVKLIGRAVRVEDGISAYVAPHLIPKSNLLAGVGDVYNAIITCGDTVGDVMFYGRGAGKLPTASAVVADIIDAVKHKNERKYFDWSPAKSGWLIPPDELKSQWYVRGEGLCDEKPNGKFAMRVLL